MFMNARRPLMTALALTLAQGAAFAQYRVDRGGPDAPPTGGVEISPELARRLGVVDPSDASMQSTIAWNKRRAEVERELKLLRHKHFRNKNSDIRQAGLLKLRAYTDPPAFAAMLEVFQGEGREVEEGMLDHFFDQATEEGDAAIAWAAVFGKSDRFRESALGRLYRRYGPTGSVPTRIQAIIAEGLEPRRASVNANAARAAEVLRLYQAIPMMIQAQAGGGGGGGGGGERPALAYIYIGTQRSFIADLNPVVGENAVAFDPVPGVITEGTVLRVTDAFVTTVIGPINTSLQNLANAGWDGRTTAHLGTDDAAWRRWWEREFRPYRAEVAAYQATLVGPPAELAGW